MRYTPPPEVEDRYKTIQLSTDLKSRRDQLAHFVGRVQSYRKDTVAARYRFTQTTDFCFFKRSAEPLSSRLSSLVKKRYRLFPSLG